MNALDAVLTWRKLADMERRKPGPPHQARAELFEAAARSIELGEETGKPHCACHLLPFEECRKLKEARGDPALRQRG